MTKLTVLSNERCQNPQGAIKGLLAQGECCTFEFLSAAVERIKFQRDFDLIVQAEVSLSAIIRSQTTYDLNQVIEDESLRKFAFFCSSIDQIIYLLSDNLYPLIAIERQSPYHDKPEQKERDLKKQLLLKKIHLPLIYQDEPRKGIIRFYRTDGTELCRIQAYAGKGQNTFDKILYDFIEPRISKLGYVMF